MKEVILNAEVVQQFLEFQETGLRFERPWAGLAPFVARAAKRRLRRFSPHRTWASDPSAVDDVTQEVARRLLKLGRPGARGRFDPLQCRASCNGFERWLTRIVKNQVTDHWRRWHGRRVCGVVVSLSVGDSSDDRREIEDTRAPAVSRGVVDFPAVLDEVLDEIPKPLGDAARLRWLHYQTDREAAPSLGVTSSAVCKRVAKAVDLVRPLLEARGIDADTALLTT